MNLKFVLSFRRIFVIFFLGLAICFPRIGFAQGVLTNGVSHSGAISAGGETDLWTTTLTQGDRLVALIAEISGGASFTPKIEILAPNGVPLGANAGGVTARLDLQAHLSGTYTVAVSDGNGTGQGSYRLQIVSVPGAFLVPAGDEGGALTNGANHQAMIEVGDLDRWSFNANSGDRIILQLGETAGGANFNPQIELFTPTGARLDASSGGVAARIDAQAEEAGTYTVLVSDSATTGTGTYQLRLVQIPAAFVVPAGDEGGALIDAVNADGAIVLGDLDPWTFTANPGERVTVQLTELTGGAGFTPLLEIFDFRGERKRFVQNASAATLDFSVETAGTNTVVVSDANQTGVGTYRLNMTRTAIAPGANVLVNGRTHVGSINAAGQSNIWTFTATVGESIVVRAGETATAGLVPWLRLSGPNGALLSSDFNATAAEVSTRATNSGTFTVALADGSAGRNQTGNYQLSLAKSGGALSISPGDEGGPLTNGISYLATLDTGDLDGWTFTANAGENIAVWMGEITAGASLLPWLRLYGPEGALLVDDFNAAAAEVTIRATNSGTFLVVIGDGNSARGGVGDYRLSLAKTGNPLTISPLDEGGPLTNGSSYIAALDTGDIDVWTFIANQGETVIVRAGETTTGALLPWIRLYGPNGASLSEDFNASAAEVTARATNSGTFTVFVGDGTAGRGSSGNYRLSLAKTGAPLVISPSDEGADLVNGTTYIAAIETGDIDAWTFTAHAGENIIVRMGETITGTFLPWLRLYGPNGVLLSDDFNAAAAEVTTRATNTGIFLVVAGDGNSGLGGSGNYRINLAKTGEPLAISAGDEGGLMNAASSYEGMLDVGDVDAWTFTACAGERIFLRVDELVTNSPLLPWIRLYGRDGALLNANFGEIRAEISRTAPANGTYLLVVADGNSGLNGTGTYRLTTLGLFAGIKLCVPMRLGTSLGFQGAGGTPNTPYVIVTATNIGTPAALWTPILTNNFGGFGEFSFTNAINLSLPEQYFRLRSP